MRLIGMDPGFASCGLVVWEDGKFVGGTVLRSQKGTGKSVDDNLLRARNLAAAVQEYTEGAKGVCAEAMSFPRHASVAHKMGLAWGAVAAVCDCPMFLLSPQRVRELVGLKKGATKSDIQAMMLSKHPELADHEPKQKTLREHYYDAAAVLVAWLESDAGRFLTK